MSKNKDTDYSNTIIYKITCKDKAVTDLYVGHTINFVERKTAHRRSCVKNNCKVYKVIRENGGWSNWIMEIIAFYNCKDLTEARIKEQEHFVSSNANLNSIEPFPSKILNKDVVSKKASKAVNCEQITEAVTEAVTSKKHTKGFTCDKCEYTCKKASDFKKHTASIKHKGGNTINIAEDIKCIVCNKKYSTKSGLWKHNKNCIIKEMIVEKPLGKIIQEEIQNLTTVVRELIKINDNFQKQMLEFCKNNKQ